MAKHEIPEGSIVLSQEARFFAPNRRFEAVAYDPDGGKHNGFGNSAEAAYRDLQANLKNAGFEGEIHPKKRAGNSGLALVEGAKFFNEMKPVTKKEAAEASEVTTAKPEAKK